MIPVLDKGQVSIKSISVGYDQLRSLIVDFNGGAFDPKFLKLPHLTLQVKCPLFVTLFLMENGIATIQQKSTSSTLESYVPSIPDISGPDLATNQAIQADIQQANEALLLNPKAYQMDGCDHFTAQVNIPISVYNTVIAYAPLANWLDLINQKHLPRPVEAYRKAIDDIVTAEWGPIKQHLRLNKK